MLEKIGEVVGKVDKIRNKNKCLDEYLQMFR